MNYEGWLTWCKAYESAAFTGFTGDQLSLDAYNEAVATCGGVKPYLPTDELYTLLVYRLAMHNFILLSNLEIAPLTDLYTKYDIADGRTQGVLQSASNGPTSASRMIPNALQDGDATTLLLWCTPYGQFVEGVFEQIRPFAVVI
jgi:hypothetical protein